MNHKKIYLMQITAYFIAVCLLMGQAVMWGYIGINTHSNLFKYILVLLCGCSLLFAGTFEKRDLLLGMAFAAYFVIYLVMSPDNIKYVLLTIVIPSIAMIIAFKELNRTGNLEWLFKAYSNIVFLLAALSLFFWIAGSLLNVIPGRIKLEYEWAEHIRSTYTYLYLYFENPVQNMKILGKSIARNTGLFTEAPGFCSVLSYAIIIEVFYFRKRIGRILILVIALFSTLSTKGFAVILILFAYYYIKMTGNIKTYSRKALMLALIPAAAVVLGGAGLAIISHKSGTGSFAIRVDDLMAGLTVWKRNLLFGAGYRDDYLVALFNVSRDNDGLSMGLTTTLAKGGIYLVSFYLFPMIRILIDAGRKNMLFDWIFVSALLLFEFFISNVGASLLFLGAVAVMYSYCFNGVGNNKAGDSVRSE